MSKYFNPGNAAFAVIRNDIYIDKTGLIGVLNSTINTPRMLTCVSRPRRFGKSFAAKMLCAYYDHTCDSDSLFADLEIAREKDYHVHLNQYHVLNLDITGFISDVKKQQRPLREVPMLIEHEIRRDLLEVDPALPRDGRLTDCMLRFVERTGRKCIFVIDEWDALIREAKDDLDTQEAYLNLLREWFKNNNFTPRVVAAAYMTGILPIKKDGSQSAISDFLEYPILYPGAFASYTGFTEEDVQQLCEMYSMDFQKVRSWYDGYEFAESGSMYNPYSVMSAIRNKKLRSYWQKTSTAESLRNYINMDFDGLQETIAHLIAGEEYEIDIDHFENDFVTFHSKDDVLTLLIHLGYLTYREHSHSVRIPNEEVQREFQKMLEHSVTNHNWVKLMQKSESLLDNTLQQHADIVAQKIDEIRQTQYAPTFYNNEQALRYIIKFAYIAALEKYVKVEELPSGKGIADVVYIPKRESMLPVLLIELKWNPTGQGAIEQIKDRNYPEVIREFGSDILCVGINYDPESKRHDCCIEKNLWNH